MTPTAIRTKVDKPPLSAVHWMIGRDLLWLRVYRGWSRAKVGRLCGIKASTVERIEMGRCSIRMKLLEKMVNALKGRFQVSTAPGEQSRTIDEQAKEIRRLKNNS